MTISSLDTLVAGLIGGEVLPFYKSPLTTISGNYYSLWKQAGMPGAGVSPPTGAGEVPTSASSGALPFTNPASGKSSYLANLALTAGAAAMLTLYDRLCHTSGLSGTSTSAQAVNTTPLTRYTDGKGVEAWLEVYSALGVTSRTATVSYTNQAGVSGRTGTATIGASAGAQRMFPVALANGDYGVRSVESVTLSGSTGTAGDFGVTLMKGLADLSAAIAGGGAVRDAIEVGLPQVLDNACLAVLITSTATSTGTIDGMVQIAKN